MDTSYLSAITLGTALAVGCAGQQHGGFDISTDKEQPIMVPETVPMAPPPPAASSSAPPVVTRQLPTGPNGLPQRFLDSDEEVVKAGGIDKFISNDLKPDTIYRLYTYENSSDPKCVKFEESLGQLFVKRGDVIRFTMIDIGSPTKKSAYTGAVPFSILRFGDCPKKLEIKGPQSATAMEAAMKSLKTSCPLGR